MSTMWVTTSAANAANLATHLCDLGGAESKRVRRVGLPKKGGLEGARQSQTTSAFKSILETKPPASAEFLVRPCSAVASIFPRISL